MDHHTKVIIITHFVSQPSNERERTKHQSHFATLKPGLIQVRLWYVGFQPDVVGSSEDRVLNKVYGRTCLQVTDSMACRSIKRMSARKLPLFLVAH